jgi:putative oxidoreductase
MVHAALALRTAVPAEPPIVYLFDVVIGLLFLVGIYTPIVVAVLAVVSIWRAFLHPANPWTCILLAAVAAGLALLGPGAWSVDARLFGRREIELPDRKR